jgi:dephospho-CoA kinase
MIRIGILGDIGSGKSYVAKKFGYPVFNADKEVGKLYKKNKKVLKKFKRVLPRYFKSLPINKKNVSQAILDNKNNLKKIIKIVHVEIRKKMNFFLKKNKSQKFVILDIPLLLENNINNKNDILVFVQTKKRDVLKKLKIRKNFNKKLMNQFSKIQLPLDYKKKKSQFVIKNDFKRRTVLKYIKNILREID